MKLIDKDKLLEELKKLKQNLSASPIVVIEDVESLVESLEVKEVDLENSVKGRIDYPLIGVDFPNIYPNYKELKDYCDKNGIKDEDEVKIIIIKDIIL